MSGRLCCLWFVAATLYLLGAPSPRLPWRRRPFRWSWSLRAAFPWKGNPSGWSALKTLGFTSVRIRGARPDEDRSSPTAGPTTAPATP